MSLFVPDMLDNKTEAHLAASVRIAAIGIGAGFLLVGLGCFFALVF